MGVCVCVWQPPIHSIHRELEHPAQRHDRRSGCVSSALLAAKHPPCAHPFIATLLPNPPFHRQGGGRPRSLACWTCLTITTSCSGGWLTLAVNMCRQPA